MTELRRAAPLGLARIPPELSVVLLALFLPLDHLAANADRVPLADLPRPLALVTLGSGGLAWALGHLAGDRVAGALVAVGLTMSFWAAGTVSSLGRALGVPGWGGVPTAGAVLVLAVVAARALGSRLGADPGAAGRLRGLLAGVALIFAGPAVGKVLAAYTAAPPAPVAYPALPPPRPGTSPPKLPDVYLLVLDAFGREDVLEELYGAGDAVRGLAARLEELGFRVRADASANYMGTLHSMAAILNLGYLPMPPEMATAHPRDHRPLLATLAAPRWLELARQAGYRTRLVGTGSDVWDPAAFDEVLDPGPRPYEHLLLALSAVGEAAPEHLHAGRRARLRGALSATPAPPVATPTFTLLHLMAPHPPFSFAADGGPFRDQARFLFNIDRSELLDRLEYPGYYRDGYRAQASFLAQQVGALAEQLVSRRQQAPVVWIFGDHGPRLGALSEPPEAFDRERLAVLQALHLPDGLRDPELPARTLVQTARGISWRLFGVPEELGPARAFRHLASNEYDLSPCALPGLRVHSSNSGASRVQRAPAAMATP